MVNSQMELNNVFETLKTTQQFHNLTNEKYLLNVTFFLIQMEGESSSGTGSEEYTVGVRLVVVGSDFKLILNTHVIYLLIIYITLFTS